MNNKILISFLLVVLMALSLSAVSAADDIDDVVAAESDDAVEVLAESYQPTANSSDAVQTAIDSANATGDIIDLSNFASYDFGEKTVTVTKSDIVIKGDGNTVISGYGNGNGLFDVTGSNVVIQGINFIDTNPANNLTYQGTVSGWGVRFFGVTGATVQNCTFQDFNQAIRAQRSANIVIDNNMFMGGMSTKLINDPTVNKEEGSKTISIMGSSNITVSNNIISGPMLDGVSIASGSGQSAIVNNTFAGNAYAIYFGGASTAGCSISDNTFIGCGAFYEPERNISMEGFPVISIQKSSDNIKFSGNTFEATENSILIAAEAGNTAHGGETQIGNVTVVKNTVKALDDADLSTVTLFDVLVRTADVLNLTSPLNVTENIYEGAAKGVVIHFNNTVIFSAQNAYLNESLDANHIYGPATLYATTLVIDAANGYVGDDLTFKVTLTDSNGVGVANKGIIIFMNDNKITADTDSLGVVEVPFIASAAGTQYVSAAFLGEGNMYSGSSAFDTIKVVKKSTALTAAKATLKVKKAKKVTVTLKSSGKAVAGKKVTITVNKKTFTAKTNKNGKATISVKVAKKGKFTAVVKFAGDSAYKAVTKKVKYTVKK